MDSEKKASNIQVVPDELREADKWRRQCGCLRTSAKLKQILHSFPAPPPPTPINHDSKRVYYANTIPKYDGTIITKEIEPSASYSAIEPQTDKVMKDYNQLAARQSSRDNNAGGIACIDKSDKQKSRSWVTVTELAQLVQLSVTATALVLYYLLYCYMQLIYYTLRSAMYFHQADGPMKVTIGVVTVTSLIVGFHILLRMERLIGFI